MGIGTPHNLIYKNIFYLNKIYLNKMYGVSILIYKITKNNIYYISLFYIFNIKLKPTLAWYMLCN